MKNPELTIYQRRLPHWRYEGSTYFVTWRLHGKQMLLKPAEKDLIMAVIKHFDEIRYKLYAYVVMDNHAHVLFSTKIENRVQDIVHSWKSFSANKLQREFVRHGAIWQDEYFDRIVRNDAEFMEKANYILNNPGKRWPEVENYKWVWHYGKE
jgi:REP element-mobilizing transposase RayT